MTTFTQAQGAKSSSALPMGTLAASNFLASATIDLGASMPLDVTFEVECTPSATPTGDKQLIVMAQLSLDGSTFTTGPTSGTTATNEPDLHWIGTIVCNDNSLHRKMFSLQGLPTARYLKLVVKNGLGVALSSGNIYRADITGAA